LRVEEFPSNGRCVIANNTHNSVRVAANTTLVLAVGLLVGAGVMAAGGYNPFKGYLFLLRGAFGDRWGLADTLGMATPLILTGLTFGVGVRAGLFNIGAEGQLFFGALAAVAVSTLSLPTALYLPLTLGAGMTAGALWSLIPALLKVKRGVHEVVSTIMLNWVARWFALYLILFLADPASSQRTIKVVSAARFSQVIAGSNLSYALLVSVAFAVLIYALLWSMTHGFELRVAGLNPDSARYSGISPNKGVYLGFVLGGLAAGLAGALVAAGQPPQYAIKVDLSTLENIGFNGIAVALIGRNHPLGALLGGLFMGALATGARFMQIQAHIPMELVFVVQGVIILAMAVPELRGLLRKAKSDG